MTDTNELRQHGKNALIVTAHGGEFAEVDAIAIADELDDLRAELNELKWKVRAADAMADAVAVLVQIRKIDSRSRAADALLDYRDPPRDERTDAMAIMESELATAKADAERYRVALTEIYNGPGCSCEHIITSEDADTGEHNQCCCYRNWRAANVALNPKESNE